MSGTVIRPFAGLRVDGARAAEVVAPPYDVVTEDEARAQAAGRPWSFFHVSRPEIDFPPGTDPHAPEVYAKAAENLRRMVDDGVLRRDAAPCYYVYRLTTPEGHAQTGLIVAGSVDAYHANVIRRHELTRPGKETDRVRQIEATGAQTGPVMVAHRPHPAISRICAEATAAAPVVEVTGPDGVLHSLWVIDDAARQQVLTDAFEENDALYIADGHHRSAAAARVAATRQAAGGDAGSSDRILMVAFPYDQMRILDYNRIVLSLGSLTLEEFLEQVGAAFDVVREQGPVRPARPHEFGMYTEGHWYRLTVRPPLPPQDDVVAGLDVSLLYERLLQPILGIGDPRTDPRIDFVGGIRGLVALRAAVDNDDAAVAFSLFPTRFEELMAVADAGLMMPPKSTWFEPKLLDGLVSLVID